MWHVGWCSAVGMRPQSSPPGPPFVHVLDTAAGFMGVSNPRKQKTEVRATCGGKCLLSQHLAGKDRRLVNLRLAWATQ